MSSPFLGSGKLESRLTSDKEASLPVYNNIRPAMYKQSEWNFCLFLGYDLIWPTQSDSIDKLSVHPYGGPPGKHTVATPV